MCMYMYMHFMQLDHSRSVHVQVVYPCIHYFMNVLDTVESTRTHMYMHEIGRTKYMSVHALCHECDFCFLMLVS